VAQERSQSPADSGRIRVLFADDHQIVRESLVNLLNTETDIHVVGQCDNGRKAVESAGQVQPDVVIMDVSMPVMDGVEATRVIKSRWPHIRIIGLSMYDDADGGGKMRAAGADEYVSKAGPPAELINAIRKWGTAAKTGKATVSGSRSPCGKRR
jgi:DNA-binding NarL/FixJ family response regulator